MEENAIERANRKLRNIENPDVPYNERFFKVDEVAALLQISESTAYRFMAKMNRELKAKGKETFGGRLSVRYLKERVYI